MRPTSTFGDYTANEQIDYTCEYIDKVMNKIVYMGNSSTKVKKLLTHYRRIMSVTTAELGDLTYKDYVKSVTAE